MASDTPWSQFSESDYSLEQYQRACLISGPTKAECKLPVREPDGTLNKNGVAAAAGRLNQTQGISDAQRKDAAKQLMRLYSQCGMDAPDHLEEMADMTDSPAEEDAEQSRARYGPGEVLQRAASVQDVNFPQRIISILAVPYEQPTPVEYRGEMWREVFSRTAFQGFNPNAPKARTVPVSAKLQAPAYDHEGAHLVGRVVSADPSHPEGLMLETRISKTPTGDEMLALADDHALHPSIGFISRGADTRADRRTMTRRVNRAFLDHLTYVPTPAYEGAKVLAMRAAPEPPPLVATPALDQFLSDRILHWADERLSR